MLSRISIPIIAALVLAGGAAARDSDDPIGGYIPSIALSIVGVVLWGIWSLIAWTHMIRMGQKWLLVFPIGLSCMTLGFILRIVNHSTYTSISLYAVQQLFILLSPCAFLATDYVLLSHLGKSFGPEVDKSCLVIPNRLLVRIFVISDVVTFLIQAGGGGLSASKSPSTANTGQKIALVGLILQLVSFALFTSVLLSFAFRLRSRFPDIWRNSSDASTWSPLAFWRTSEIPAWKTLMYTMLLTCVGILIRCAYRIAEYSQGYNGYLPTHESFFYCLDSLPLFLAMGLYMFVYPVRFHQAVVSEAGNTPLGEYPKTTSKV